MGLLEYIILHVINIYTILIIIYILMSWFPGARQSQFGYVLSSLCEPYLEQFRKIIPPLGMIDISPIIGIFVLHFLKYGVVAIFAMLG